MLDVLTGFLVVIFVIALGFGVGRLRLLGPGSVYTLNMFVFWIALPMMLIHFLSDADLAQLFGVNFAVVAISTLGAGAVGYAGYRFIAGKSRSNSLVAMLASSYCNGTHLGIPLMAHLIGDPTVTLPVVMFQVGFYGPLSVMMLDLSSEKRASHGLIRELVLSILRNPLIIGAVTGIGLALLKQNTGFVLPKLLAEPIAMVSNATVAVALIAFGMSMAEVKVLQKGLSPVRSVFAASLVKTVVHPFIAWLLGAFVFGTSGSLLLAMVLIAALPTGQNVFTYAQRFGVNTVLARDTVVIATALSLPAMAIIVVLLG
ncbi:AEC family transporter [Corynebacterium anserum]|uniref:AEC family transporter n=1 Tax=Corynebacterium anserum TaxID=2684406 RepID=A0A7G7YPJ4_9CORY|nr:AEC family transporter [Corynebacterium anserum]MBC2682045.1 AEC family transporter [Corynebacterium anserum]QNH96414.1 AEC family transporter [Corynebacterium anserum]